MRTHSPSDQGNIAATDQYEQLTGGKIPFPENRKRPSKSQIATLPLSCMGGPAPTQCLDQAHILAEPSGRDAVVDANRMRHCPPVQRRRWPVPQTACGRTAPNLPADTRRLASSSPRDRRRWPRQAVPHGTTDAGPTVSTLPYRGFPHRGTGKRLASPGSNPGVSTQYRFTNTVDLRTAMGRVPNLQVRTRPRACGRSRTPVRGVNLQNDDGTYRTPRS